MQKIAIERIPLTLELLDAYIEAARAEWLYDNKYFGFDVVEIRLGGLKERLKTAKRTIEEYLNGGIETIEFLDVKFVEVSSAPKEKPYRIQNDWKSIASCSLI